MKFICEKCKTKYSIADEKVRRKVLKIRCKNCSNIIVVREPVGAKDVGAADPNQVNSSGKPLEQAFDGAFRPRPHRPSISNLALRVSPTSIISTKPMEKEHAPLAAMPPEFLEEEGALIEDEWFLAIDGNQFGPMAFSELCSRVKRGEARDEAFVWRDGFDEWLEINQVPELKPFLPRHPPPPPRPRSGHYPMARAASPSSSPEGLGRPQPPQVPSLPLPALMEGAGGFSSAAPSSQGALPDPAAPSLISRRTYQSSVAIPQGVPLSQQHQSYLGPLPHEATPIGSPAGLPPSAPESGLKPLPIIVEPYEPQLGPVPAGAAPAPSTPLWLKITAVASIMAAVSGAGLIVYLLLIDRPSAKDQTFYTKLMAGGSAQQTPASPLPASTASAADAGTAPIQISPMELELSRRERSAKIGPSVKAWVKPTLGKEKKNNLSQEQMRLMALYGQPAGALGGKIPAVTPEKRRPKGPTRQITENEVSTMQKKYKAVLRSCYERVAKRDESLNEVKAEITVTLNDDGLVRDVRVKAGDSAELSSCLSKVIQHWAFEPMGQQTFMFSINFRGY